LERLLEAEVPEIEINTTNVNEVEDEKEEKNDTR